MNLNYKKYQNLLLLLLLTSFGTYYSYTNNKPLEEKELAYISGKLNGKPQHRSTGDIPEPYIRLELYGDERRYNLIYCSYDNSKKNLILKSEENSDVLLSVKEKDIYKEIISVYELTINGVNCLNLESYNKCYTNKWRRLIVFIYAIGAIIIMLLIWDLFKWFNSPPVACSKGKG